MDLELATTEDILKELRKRNMHFVFVGMSERNARSTEFYYACQGVSQDELLQLVHLLEECLARRRGTE